MSTIDWRPRIIIPIYHINKVNLAADFLHLFRTVCMMYIISNQISVVSSNRKFDSPIEEINVERKMVYRCAFWT